jgi:methyl-accepting chemotaxis protein
MFNLKFKIGTKLGISAGLGVVLVAAMVINQQMSGGSIAVANKTMRLEAEVAKKVVEAKESVRAMQLATRGMRAAKTMDQVKTGLATLNAKHTALLAQLDAAMPLASRPEDKDRLGRIRSLGEQYYTPPTRSAWP